MKSRFGVIYKSRAHLRHALGSEFPCSPNELVQSLTSTMEDKDRTWMKLAQTLENKTSLTNVQRCQNPHCHPLIASRHHMSGNGNTAAHSWMKGDYPRIKTSISAFLGTRYLSLRRHLALDLKLDCPDAPKLKNNLSLTSKGRDRSKINYADFTRSQTEESRRQ